MKLDNHKINCDVKSPDANDMNQEASYCQTEQWNDDVIVRGEADVYMRRIVWLWLTFPVLILVLQYTRDNRSATMIAYWDPRVKI